MSLPPAIWNAIAPDEPRLETRCGEGIVLDFLSPSPEAAFYNTMFAHPDAAKPELWHERKAGCNDPEFVDDSIRVIVEELRTRLSPAAIVVELGGGVAQRRSGFLSRIFSNYVPLDISLSSIKGYAANFGRLGMACDATRIPFRDGTVDCVFSRTFLEHPRRPDLVVKEIVRITRPGAIVVHADAWFCRWWNRYAIVGLKRFRNMSPRERLIYIAARITEHPMVRLPPKVARRLLRELFVPRSPTELPHQKLKPNYDLFLGCDEDASSSIDPLDVIRFYEANGFETLAPLNFWQRLGYRNVPVLMQQRKTG